MQRECIMNADFLKGYAGGGASEILQSPDCEAPWGYGRVVYGII